MSEDIGETIEQTSKEIRQKLLNEEMDLSHMEQQDYINHLIFRELEKLVHEGKLSAEDVNLQL